MDARAFDGRRQSRERMWKERQAALERQRTIGLLGGKKRERDFRGVSFFAAEAGPERRVHNGLDDLLVRSRRQAGVTTLGGDGALADEVLGNVRSDAARCRVRR
jgi:hypothetical protein